ncbi:MAG: helix-turn-helix domain-containing protein [Marinoscillum sp.]
MTLITDYTKSDFIKSVKEINHLQSSYQLTPNNYIRVILNLGDTMEREMIGSIRSTTIAKGELTMMGCQSRAFTLSGESLHYIEVCINPVYSRLIFSHTPDFNRNESQTHLSENITNQGSLLTYLNATFKWKDYTPDHTLLHAIEMIKESKGEIKISSIYDTLQVSKSNLEQKFSYHLGLTAKEFCKIEKLKNFLENYKLHGKNLNLTQLTFKSGYYDQSHLIKDFRYFMDCKPREFFKGRELLNHL